MTITNIDVAHETATKIFAEIADDLEKIVTEEDAKFKIINRILNEVLGWPHKSFKFEEKNIAGFSDCIVHERNSDGLARNHFLVEAKRIGKLPLSSTTATRQYYKLSGPALKPSFPVIEQAASYAAPLGIQLSVVTDGITWIIFHSIVLDEEYYSRKAIVFPNLNSILECFAEFYNLLSKDDIHQKIHRIIFDKIHENRVTQSAPLCSPIQLRDIHINQKSALAFELEAVYSFFFSTLSGEDDPDLEINCFVETKESRVADYTLEKMTAHVLGNISPASKGVDAELSTLIKDTFEVDQGQTVFLVGPTGSGKSTFLKRFFKKTLPRTIREQCAILNVNCLDASGNDETSIAWLTERFITIIEKVAFPSGVPQWDDLHGLYHTEYVRRAEGVDKQIYERSKEEFKEKFSQYMEEKIENDRELYLKRLLHDLISNRKKLPIMTLDNTDEFSLEYKEKIFQYCQSLKRELKFCIIIFPVTDKSAWIFSKTDIFNIYTSKSFFLPTPPPREVFRKRIEYLKGKISANTTSLPKKSGEYFSLNAIKIKIADLSAFASVIEDVFVEQEITAKRIGELSNYNIRKTLKLSKRVITSSFLNIEDLIRIYVAGDRKALSFNKFMKAMLLGDYNHYRQMEDHGIFPIFQVDENVRQSPLIYVRILYFLRGYHQAASSDANRYVDVESIVRYFDLTNATEASVDVALKRLLDSALIERYDISDRVYSNDLRVAISYSGLAHLDMAMYNYAYFEEMALTTRISNPEVASEIRSVAFSKQGMSERMGRVRNTFISYLIAEDEKELQIPKVPDFANQLELVGQLRSSQSFQDWRYEAPKVEEQPPARVEGYDRVGIVGNVDFFHHTKGYGFVSIEGISDQAYLPLKVIQASGFDTVHSMDEILCDIQTTDKGLSVTLVHEIASPVLEEYQATVVRLFPERGYGFASVQQLGVDASFDFFLLEASKRERLALAQEMKVQIKRDKNTHNYHVVRVVECLDLY